MNASIALRSVLALLWLASAGAQAHHSAAPHFDMSKSVKVVGMVTSFRFVNPHSYIYFTEREADGRSVEWRCELPARTALARLGWTEDLFKVGRTVTITGAPARREANVCYLDTLTTDTGTRYSREQQVSRVVMAAPAPRAARDESGHPNLAGQWVAAGRGPPLAMLFGPPQATAAGQTAASRYDQRFDDPAVHCSPANIVFGWTHDSNVNRITQTRDAITLQYGYMDLVRVIHLNQTRHPGSIEPSLSGHSIGRWERDVLVVDTVAFAPGVLIPMAGLMHSDQLQVTERFTVDAAHSTLKRDYTVTDPLYLKQPWRGSDTQRSTAEPYRAFACEELSGRNNQRPGTPVQ